MCNKMCFLASGKCPCAHLAVNAGSAAPSSGKAGNDFSYLGSQVRTAFVHQVCQTCSHRGLETGTREICKKKKTIIIVCYVEIWSIILTMKMFVYSVFLKNCALQLKDQILDLGNRFYKFMFHRFI